MKKLFASMIAAAFLLTGSAMAGASTKSPTMTSAKKQVSGAKSTMTHSKIAKKAKHTKKHVMKPMSAKKAHKKIAKKKHAIKKMTARKLHRKHHKHSAKWHHRA